MNRLHLGVPSPALIVSVVALLVSLGGTSYAAFTLPKNSVGTRQLKNGAVATSKIKNGAVTAKKINASGLAVPNASHADVADTATNAGHATTADTATNARHATTADTATNARHATTADNATRAANATNATNASHATDATNARHATTADNATKAANAINAANATNASRATNATNASELGGQTPSFYAPASLPSGQTETGIYAVIGNGNLNQSEVVTFRIPLREGVPEGSAHFIPALGATTADCPGVGKAARGQLCIYEQVDGNQTLGGIFDPTTGINPSANAAGFAIDFKAAGPGLFHSYGTWAVTAP